MTIMADPASTNSKFSVSFDECMDLIVLDQRGSSVKSVAAVASDETSTVVQGLHPQVIDNDLLAALKNTLPRLRINSASDTTQSRDDGRVLSIYKSLPIEESPVDELSASRQANKTLRFENKNLKASIDGLERQAGRFRDQSNELRGELAAKEEIISSLRREIGLLTFRIKELESLNRALKVEASQKSNKDIRRG